MSEPNIYLTAAEADAIRQFYSYGATRGNHSDEGRGPAPGPLTSYIGDMGLAVAKVWALIPAETLRIP